MRCVPIWILAAMIVCCNGCDRKRNLADIPIMPNLTMDEYEDQVGTPSVVGNSNHWIAYHLKSGGELRLYFFNGPPGGRRTLSQAYVYVGNYLSKRIFDLPAPTTAPATNLSTLPTTLPVELPKP